MNMDLISDIIMLLAAVIGLLSCLYRYIESPKRGWLFASMFFLANLLSDYYWATYSLVMKDSPDISAFIAYFGWNAGYVILLIAVRHMRDHDSRGFFHPLMLLPIPVNIAQLVLYNSFGGIFNNIWQVFFTTLIAIYSLQSILYYLKNRKQGTPLPYFHLLVFVFIFTEYGMWTSSCFDWPSDLANPYYYFTFINYLIEIFFAWGIYKEYEAYGHASPEPDSAEIRFRYLLQGIVTAIIFVGLLGGYYLASWMKNSLPVQGDEEGAYSIIAIVLFAISVFMVVLMLAVIYTITLRHRTLKAGSEETIRLKRNRANLAFTILIALGLMIFTVVYNSRLYYSASVDAIYRSGEDETVNVAAELDNYLTIAQSTLRVTADTVDLMLANGNSNESICKYLQDQTDRQKLNFDENFTGLYAYINGEYMDGLGWEPPADYDPTTRDWYKDAEKAGGDIVIVPPYLDAQTGSIVITICKMIPTESTEADQINIVSLDVIVTHIQEVCEQADVGGKGYAMIVNRDGFIVAHHDPELSGRNIGDVYDEGLLDSLISTDASSFETLVGDEESTLFVSNVMDQWYVVIVVNNSELMKDSYSQLWVNVAVSLTIFILISLFYYLGFKNEQAYGSKVEEMSISRQKQEYEAEMLRRDKASADEANKAKSSFLADMSHEIRTPINAILGMNEMILRESDNKDILEYAGNIQNSGRSLLSLINSILDFSKIEDGKMDIVPVRYSVRSMITYLYSSIYERAEAKNLRFIMEIDPGLPSELYGDDTRINQIILNLLTNAVKYTPEGSVTMTLRAKEIKDDRVLIYASVRDTGIGIREEDMEKLFETFSRLDQVRNRNIEGTGLGMSIVTKLLELMGSSLQIESKYGEGSNFYFELWQKIENATPLGDYNTDGDMNTESGKYRESFTAPDVRLLLVDDTKVNILVLKQLLKKTCIQTDTAVNGMDAIRMAESCAYDCILLDQRMPGMDGTQTLMHIRENENSLNKDTPVICLTADAIRGAREKYLSEGFDDYLTKPVDGRALETMLIRYLPPEKVHVSAPDDPDGSTDGTITETDSSKSLTDRLKSAGFDVNSALKYFEDDDSLYRIVLSEFVNAYPSNSEKLQKYHDTNEWDGYSILVHSIKSTADSIGCYELYKAARDLEKASRDENRDAILTGHDSMMKLYEQVAKTVKNILRETGGLDQEDNDDDIYEFAPS